MDYPNLFKPIKLGGTLFRNRIFSSPTGHPDNVMGRFSDEVVAYFERKAKGGAAAVTLGEASVDSRYGKNYAAELSLDSRQPLRGLSLMADRIRRHGAIPSIELQHKGMKAKPGLETPGVCVASNDVYAPSACVYQGVQVKEMPEDLILETIDRFAAAAKFVKDCGFGMVTIHGAHGWLINQFMCERTNRREDRWGGTVENRARFAVEICDAIHRACGKDFPVEIRISASESVEGGYDADYGALFAKQLEGHADLIHCSASFGIYLPEEYRTLSIMCPSMFREEGCNVKYAAEVKKLVTATPIATVGALSDPAMMEEIIASGKADVVELARALICDPDLPNKAREGRADDILKCMRCYNCFSNGVQRGAFWCAVNPETNRERIFGAKVPAERKKVLVAGGGIAGMEAALTAAANGHEVVLCEKSGRLGGQIRCEENVPFKANLAAYIARQERRIAASDNIEVRLDTEVTPDYARAQGADVIIAALGAKAITPNIPGADGKNVLPAAVAYAEPEKVGRTAVILGGGLVGMELAIYLNSLGREVEVVEMADKFSPFPNVLHGNAVSIKLREEGIQTHFGEKAVAIDDGGVTVETAEGVKRREAETVIIAVGERPRSDEAAALYDAAPRFIPIGDCVVPGNVADATIAARSVAEDIGR
jgi:2,4-dienoyl-CoA reductase-like NADH-dependent reductase (Old Yellow Enzyme family)/thioredoxin reductase